MAKPINVDLGLRIHKLLKRGKLSQNQIASYLGICKQTVTFYKRWVPPKVVTVAYGDEITVDFTEDEFARLQVLKREKLLERERMEREYGEA